MYSLFFLVISLYIVDYASINSMGQCPKSEPLCDEDPLNQEDSKPKYHISEMQNRHNMSNSLADLVKAQTSSKGIYGTPHNLVQLMHQFFNFYFFKNLTQELSIPF